MEICLYCGAEHRDDGPRCPWHRLAGEILDLRTQLTSISERIDQIMSSQSDLDTELTAVEAAEAAEEAELTQESSDLKTLLAAIPPETAVNLSAEIARLQALATTMGARTTSATADDASITAETKALEPTPAPAPPAS